MSIHSLEEARKLWSTFYSKFKTLGKEENHFPKRYEGKVDHPVNGNPVEITPEKLAAFNKLKTLWRQQQTKDTLIEVNPLGYHSKLFAHFVRGQKLKKSINRQKLDSVIMALNTGAWNDPIFKDITIAELSLSLFASNKITYQQTCTLLEAAQIPEDKTYFPILDQDGEFTQMAIYLLLPILQAAPFLKSMSQTQLNDFKLLIQALPASEQYFYLTPTPKKRSLLGTQSIELGSILPLEISMTAGMDPQKVDVHLTSGARDALGLARFGLDEYVPAVPRLGILTTLDIEEGVRNKMRYAALHYHGIPDHKRIHEVEDYLPNEATSHDVSHSDIMSTLPKKTLSGLHYMIDLCRIKIEPDFPTAKQGTVLSKEIWGWIDMVFYYTFLQNKTKTFSSLQDNKELTELFCMILATGGDSTASLGGYLIDLYFNSANPTYSKLSPLGAIVMLDMIINPKNWQEKGIEPQYLLGQFKEKYDFIKGIFHLLENPPKVQIMKIIFYESLYDFIKESLGMEGLLNQIISLDAIINANADWLSEKLKFFKQPKSNLIGFKYKDKALSIESINEIISDLLTLKNPSLDERKIQDWTNLIVEGNTEDPDYQHSLSSLISNDYKGPQKFL